jgi:hypothetical protein
MADILQEIEQEIELEGAKTLLNYLQNNKAKILSDEAALVAAGESDAQALAAKLGPLAASIAEIALAALGADAPKIEGDAFLELQALLQSFIKKVQG